jgi:hypothetical protein
MGRASRRRAESREAKSKGIHSDILTAVGIKVETNAERIVEVQRYQGDPAKSPKGWFKKNTRRPRGYSDEEVIEFQAVALRASQECNHQQRRMIRSLLGQQLTPAEGTAAIKAAMGWDQNA